MFRFHRNTALVAAGLGACTMDEKPMHTAYGHGGGA